MEKASSGWKTHVPRLQELPGYGTPEITERNRRSILHWGDTMKIAAVQYEAIRGQIAENLEKHEEYMKQARQNGAEMVVFPELSVTGYLPNYSLWNVLADNKIDIIQWMKDKSAHYNVYLGVGLAEYLNGEMRNTYVITGPDGHFVGRAEKHHAESYIFGMGNGAHRMTIAGQRVGVGICADNHFTKIMQQFQKEQVSLLLMPHAWPTPYKVGNVITKEDLVRQNNELKELPKKVAQIVKTPVVFVNQVGSMARMEGLFGRLMKPDTFKLQGFSRIVASNAEVISEIDDTEGVIYSEVDLSKKENDEFSEVPNYSGWIHEGSFFIRRFLAPIDILLGQRRYKKELARFVKNNQVPMAEAKER